MIKNCLFRKYDFKLSKLILTVNIISKNKLLFLLLNKTLSKQQPTNTISILIPNIKKKF